MKYLTTWGRKSTSSDGVVLLGKMHYPPFYSRTPTGNVREYLDEYMEHVHNINFDGRKIYWEIEEYLFRSTHLKELEDVVWEGVKIL